jgi:xanthine/CO dehydrogenase XdhC/CoxF family maturation factor
VGAQLRGPRTELPFPGRPTDGTAGRVRRGAADGRTDARRPGDRLGAVRGRSAGAWPREAFDQLGGPDADTAVAALTHAPELDDEALILALRSPAFYVGAMGSRNTQRKRRERLTAAGLEPDRLQRLSGPAGLDLGGGTATEAALAILTEAVALRHGRSGARLTTSEQAIHSGGRP